ncbi:hypothetical protein ACFV2H_27670 [Streptomyces sp. NPDC059629]|uniref:hypothetical protein n=1 Tax=Streptomyces sp. NPDC059629 TaxID=3346889 RepID=UPI0036C809AB
MAANRGLPSDTSPEVRQEHSTWAAAAFAETWLTWPEARMIDWTEPAIPRTTHITRYDRAPDSTLRLIHHHDWSRGFARASGINTLTTSPADLAALHPEGTEWTTGTTVYRAERAPPRRGPGGRSVGAGVDGDGSAGGGARREERAVGGVVRRVNTSADVSMIRTLCSAVGRAALGPEQPE